VGFEDTIFSKCVVLGVQRNDLTVEGTDVCIRGKPLDEAAGRKRHHITQSQSRAQCIPLARHRACCSRDGSS
jgi:hypothetical protein